MESEPAQSELPGNFGEVVKGIYRSAFPQPWNLPALKKLGLKTIVCVSIPKSTAIAIYSQAFSTLVDEPYTPSHVAFLKENGISHHRILVQANKDPDVKIPDTVMCRILELLLDKGNHPILIHCNKGKVRSHSCLFLYLCLMMFLASYWMCDWLFPQASGLGIARYYQRILPAFVPEIQAA